MRGIQGVSNKFTRLDWDTGKDTGSREVGWDMGSMHSGEPLAAQRLVTRSKVWGCRESIHTRCNIKVEY